MAASFPNRPCGSDAPSGGLGGMRSSGRASCAITARGAAANSASTPITAKRRLKGPPIRCLGRSVARIQARIARNPGPAAVHNGTDHERLVPHAAGMSAKSAASDAADALLKAGALQDAIFNSVNFSSIATDEKGVIQIFNVGA